MNDESSPRTNTGSRWMFIACVSLSLHVGWIGLAVAGYFNNDSVRAVSAGSSSEPAGESAKLDERMDAMNEVWASGESAQDDRMESIEKRVRRSDSGLRKRVDDAHKRLDVQAEGLSILTNESSAFTADTAIGELARRITELNRRMEEHCHYVQNDASYDDVCGVTNKWASQEL